MKPATCHPEKAYVSKGLCKTCYNAKWRRAHPKPKRSRPTFAERFWSRVDKTGGQDACWIWLHHIDRVCAPGDKTLSARRASWLLTHGEWPAEGRHIEVSCGEPRCVNPRHLLSADIHERFWRYVKKGRPDECWPWTATLYKRRGYGQFKDRGRRGSPIMAHRYAYETVHGRIPSPELVVMHACDNPPCCNPAHLSLGTHGDNHADMVAKGRHPIIAQARARRADPGTNAAKPTGGQRT